MGRFEELDVWKRSCRLSVELYKHLGRCNNLSCRDQVTRAGLSIASNIAEGFERESRAELLRYLRIAKGSCGEVRTQLLIGIEANLLPWETGQALVSECYTGFPYVRWAYKVQKFATPPIVR